MSNHISVAHYVAEKMDAFPRDIFSHIHQRKITREKIACMYKQNMHTHIHKLNCMHTYSDSKNLEGVQDPLGRLRMRSAASAHYFRCWCLHARDERAYTQPRFPIVFCTAHAEI